MADEKQTTENEATPQPGSDADHGAHRKNESGHHKNHAATFVTAFVMLCGLTAISFWIANSPLMDRPPFGWAAMILVSIAKALLVILFFMHLWWERNWKYVLTIPSLIMGVLLVVLLIPDVGYRTESYTKDRIKNAPVSESWSGGVAPLKSNVSQQRSQGG